MATRRPRSAGGYHHGNLRNALLAAARDLLEERGPSSLGLREIARRVGVSAPSAYHHFPSLDAIAVGLAEQGATEMAQCLKVAPRGNRSLLLCVGEAYVRFARANPALYRLMFGEGFPTASKSGEAVRGLRQRCYETIRSALAERLPEADLPIAALYLWSVVHGLALLMIDGQVEPGEDADGVVRRVLQLGGQALVRPPGACRADPPAQR
jgi:AcrR family transcriptional regulator